MLVPGYFNYMLTRRRYTGGLNRLSSKLTPGIQKKTIGNWQKRIRPDTFHDFILIPVDRVIMKMYSNDIRKCCECCIVRDGPKGGEAKKALWMSVMNVNPDAVILAGCNICRVKATGSLPTTDPQVLSENLTVY